MLREFERSELKRPVVLAYTRQDNESYLKRFRAKTPDKYIELIQQRELAKSFVEQKCRNKDGQNIPAIRTCSEPNTLFSVQADDSAPTFFRVPNLNGAVVTIDGNAWEGSGSKLCVCNDYAFDNQNVTLLTETDPELAKMIRSSRYGGNRVELTDIAAGTYMVFPYVW